MENNKRKVILIAGNKRSGKDTVADMLASKVDNTTILHYADLMKEILAEVLGLTIDQLEFRKNNSSYAHRKYLQRFGMKMREVFGEDVWVDSIKRIIQHVPSDHIIVIPDLRMPNEVLSDALTIKVVNPNIKNNDAHISENALSTFKFDVTIINDGTLEELDAKVQDVVNRLYASGWVL